MYVPKTFTDVLTIYIYEVKIVAIYVRGGPLRDLAYREYFGKILLGELLAFLVPLLSGYDLDYLQVLRRFVP